MPKHPYRDTAILHVALAALICVFASATGGDLGTAVLVAAVYVVVATAWSWWRFSRRISAARTAPPPQPAGPGTDQEGGP